ncbi:MAG: hypothetical protein KBD00_01015 [Candidatus Peribacteraceae bacterium]|nr:hypothetical protein [Candidatus Peribacteraceae bacterium]
MSSLLPSKFDKCDDKPDMEERTDGKCSRNTTGDLRRDIRSAIGDQLTTGSVEVQEPPTVQVAGIRMRFNDSRTALKQDRNGDAIVTDCILDFAGCTDFSDIIDVVPLMRMVTNSGYECAAINVDPSLQNDLRELGVIVLDDE